MDTQGNPPVGANPGGGNPDATNNTGGVVPGTISGKPLPNTGGFPLVAGAGLLLACATMLSVRILRS